MANFQKAKRRVLQFYSELDNAAPSQIADVLAQYTPTDYQWQGFHPFNDLTGPEAVAEQFWLPLRTSLQRLQRRQDIFMAGHNCLPIDETQDDSVWVVSMGHLMGLFDAPWLGIPATRRIVMLRYAEFNQVVDNKITRSAMYFDIPHLMMQAGQQPFPPQTGAHLVQPGPVMHDGLLFAEQDPDVSAKTLATLHGMIDDISAWRGGADNSVISELQRSWRDDMIWWGPAGIGATYTIERYAEQHCVPFRDGFGDRSFNGHVCRLAEGNFCGFFGRPNLTLTPSGGFMGMPASTTPGDMRVIDIYRCDGDKLVENWIFIDLLHFWKSQGLDVLERMERIC